MTIRKLPLLLLLGLWITLNSGCEHRDPAATDAGVRSVANRKATAVPSLSDYWHQGKAEITRYELVQNRYRDLHPGEAVLIFVKEDFLTDAQVKNERYRSPNSAPVLKMNLLQRFTTGIYDYSVMTSVFTPAAVRDFPHTLKVTSSSQDWCGQSFMQLNLRGEQYDVRLFSYFEEEGDRRSSVPAVVLEDELYNRIRLNPLDLPTGELQLLPGSMFTRLLHVPVEPQSAEASVSAYSGSAFSGQELQVYSVHYPALNRRLEIVFENREPYQIVGWTDSHPSLLDGEMRTTIARRTGTVLDAYWQHNRREDLDRREALGFPAAD